RVVNDGGSSIIERRFDWGTTPSCSDGWTANVSVSGNYFSYYLGSLNPGTTYYFRAWAKNSAGWSHGRVLSFQTTSCTYSISPESKSFDSSGGTGSVGVTTESGCEWTAVSNAGWITITSGSSGTGSGTVNYSVSENTGKRSRTGTMTIAGKTFTVTQEGKPQIAPTLISPANKSHQTCSITFQWNSVPGATKYRLYLLIPGHSDWLYDETASTNYSYPPTIIGEYHWKVKAYVNGNWSDYSEEWTFYFDGVSAPTLISPSNGSEITELRPTFQWYSVSCAECYELQLAKNSSFTDMVRDNLSIHGTSWQLDNQDLVGGQTYYWRVRSSLPIGYWSDIWHFRVSSNHPPNTPSTPSGPSAGYVGTSYTFSTSATDPDGDTLTYRFDWGDGNISSWGASSQSHSWGSTGNFCVKAQAKDNQATSSWSSCHYITITRNHDPELSSGDVSPDSGDTSTI
ncbi:MAG: hypothetical protein J7J76_03395, partial [Candidatus Latescibacteria bacterium]|nr:hypothetical protein [Candidatus Latescibacterota bacterium]